MKTVSRLGTAPSFSSTRLRIHTSCFCLIATLAAACSFDASRLRATPSHALDGPVEYPAEPDAVPDMPNSGGATSPSDAVVDGSGGTAGQYGGRDSADATLVFQDLAIEYDIAMSMDLAVVQDLAIASEVAFPAEASPMPDTEADVPAVPDAPAFPDSAALDTSTGGTGGGTGGNTGTGGTSGTGGDTGTGGASGTGGGSGTGGAFGTGGDTGTGGSNGPSDPSQVGYWDFDETAPGTYADSWGNNNATGIGVAVNLKGAWGNAVRLGTAAAPTATKYLSLPTNADLMTTPYTVSVWFYPNDFGNTATSQALVAWDGAAADGSNCRGFRLSVIPPAHLTADPNCGSAGYAAVTVPVNTVQGKWNLAVVTIANRTWTIFLYNHGACTSPAPNFPKTSNVSFSGFASSGTWRLGASGTDHQSGFNGSLDELHLWNRVLSQTEIQNLCACNQTSCP